MADNVILVGFMGAGKSSVGRVLARRLGRCFVETDDMITAREGTSIPEIFATHGEARFREAEAEVVRLLALKRGDVIATGGGLPCREGIPRRCGRSAPWCGWPATSPRSTSAPAPRRRPAHARRPLARGREALYRAREIFYRQADITVDTSALGPDQVAARVALLLAERCAGDGRAARAAGA